jgi:hypothetical protein
LRKKPEPHPLHHSFNQITSRQHCIRFFRPGSCSVGARHIGGVTRQLTLRHAIVPIFRFFLRAGRMGAALRRRVGTHCRSGHCFPFAPLLAIWESPCQNFVRCDGLLIAACGGAGGDGLATVFWRPRCS